MGRLHSRQVAKDDTIRTQPSNARWRAERQASAIQTFRATGDHDPAEQLANAVVMDVSVGGFGLGAPRELPIGTPVQMRMHLPGSIDFLTAAGRVVRSVPINGTASSKDALRFRAGVQFEKISEQLAEQLVGVLRSLGSQPTALSPPSPQAGESEYEAITRRAHLLEWSQFFRGVDFAQRLQLAQVTEERSYAKDETIIRQGDPGDGFYIIIEGSVNVIGSVASRSQAGVFTETIFATLPAGQAVGEMALIDGGQRAASVVARVPTTCLFVPRDAFINTLRSSPGTTLSIMALLVERMRHADDRLSEVLQITEALTSELDLQKVYDTTVKVVQETTQAGRVTLQVLDEERSQLALVAGMPFPPGAEAGQRSPSNAGLGGWVLREKRALILTGTSHPDPEIDRLMHDIPGMTAVCVPMLLKGEPLGVLNASSVPPGTVGRNGEALPVGKALTQDEMTFLSVLAGQVAIAIEHARLYQKTNEQATTDGLTGLLNHRTFQEYLASEVDRAQRAGTELALLFVDVDSFKVINDSYGHPAGDQLLRVLTSEVLKPSLRQYDVVGRYGGDEFAVILPNTPSKEAFIVADRLRQAAKSCDYGQHELPPETGDIISFSVGLAHFPPDADDSEALLQVADRGVYFAKFLGKNQVQRGRAAAPTADDDATSLHAFLANAGRDELEAMAAAIDARDTFTAGHSRRVAEYVRWLAQALGHDKAFLDRLRLTALFHDVGKSAVPDGVLRKAGKLTEEEYERIKAHPVIGAEMLDQVPHLHEAIPAVRSHHERWDGSGYPDGLAGKDIPYTARLLAVADAYDAMTSDRLYRGALLFQDIKRIFRSGAGISWEPHLVDVWCDVLDDRSVDGATPSAKDS
ncbi:MAG: hypothetical protein CL878_10340 [Dehalococcoidia bacterium]|nr:hypothetical protein [Dehalococcoidia bacterium]